jgi:hypothetical protein
MIRVGNRIFNNINNECHSIYKCIISNYVESPFRLARYFLKLYRLNHKLVVN